jgi:hypothetical protein
MHLHDSTRSRADDEVRRLESLAAWWAEQAEHIERDRVHLRYLWAAALPLTLGASYFWNWRFGLGVIAVTALGYVQGIYLCTVHRWEYAYNLREARRDLWTARMTALKPPKRKNAAHAGFVPPHPQLINNVTPLHRP